MPEPGEAQWVEGEQKLGFGTRYLEIAGHFRLGRQSKMSVCPGRPPDLGWHEDDVGSSWMGKTF